MLTKWIVIQLIRIIYTQNGLKVNVDKCEIVVNNLLIKTIENICQIMIMSRY
jgi:hypothetical protein